MPAFARQEDKAIMEAQHTALAVADQLIRLSQQDETPVTPMQVQKLTYFCHAWSLGLGYGPLFQDAVEAWQYGPVVRSVYHALKCYGSRPVTDALTPAANFTEKEAKIIRAVWRRYCDLSGARLSRMTHAPGSPWDQVRQLDQRSQIIHNHIIRDYYAKLAQQGGN